MTKDGDTNQKGDTRGKVFSVGHPKKRGCIYRTVQKRKKNLENIQPKEKTADIKKSKKLCSGPEQSGNGRQAGAVSRKTAGTQAGTKKTLSGIRKVWDARKRGCADWYGQAKTDY